MIKKIITICLILVSQNSLAYNYSKILKSKFSSWGVSKGLASIENEDIYETLVPKKEIVVAVIDTGIDINHPFLKDNIYSQGEFSKLNYGADFSKEKMTKTPIDEHGHGTHVAGIIKSVFPYVKILAIKYYNPLATGQVNLDATIKALQYAVDMNVDIINYSGGGPEASVEELRVLKSAEKKGILIVAAAGNERSNIDDKRHAYYPASYGLSNIITVGAHDDSLNIMPSSNYGHKSVDIAAPGYRIRSSIPNAAAGYMTGTSQSTAFVAGVSALIKSLYPQLRPVDLKKIISNSGKEVVRFNGKIKNSKKLHATNALKLADKYVRSIDRKISNEESQKNVNPPIGVMFDFSKDSSNDLIKNNPNTSRTMSSIYMTLCLVMLTIVSGIFISRKK